jgi:hypothetical protein
VKTKKPIRPIWTTTVDPSEYDYVAQFTQTVKWANKNKELYPPTDVGKVWGLVQAYQRLERENVELRAESKLLNAAQKISEETDEPIIRDILSLRAKVDELEHENAEELRRIRADKTEVLGKLAQVERENEKLRAELWSARRQLDDSMRPSNEDLEGAFEWLRKNAPVSIRYMTGNEQWSLPPAYCVLVKDRLFYGTTVFHAVREAMLSKP